MIFEIGRAVIGVSWAKSLSWYDTTKTGAKIHMFLSIGIVERDKMYALRIIILPVSLMIALPRKGRPDASQ